MGIVGDVANVVSRPVGARLDQLIEAVPCGPQYLRPEGLELSWSSLLITTATADHSRASWIAMSEPPVDGTTHTLVEVPH